MSLQIGQPLPEGTLFMFGKAGIEAIPTGELFRGRRVVAFAVPGAFTPTCSDAHLPGFIVHADELRATGVEEIICLAVNDPFVMRAWWQASGEPEGIRFLSDGNGDWTMALGMLRDMRKAAMGMRSARYAMLVEDGVPRWFGVDETGLANSTAEAVLEALRA